MPVSLKGWETKAIITSQEKAEQVASGRQVWRRKGVCMGTHSKVREVWLGDRLL